MKQIAKNYQGVHEVKTQNFGKHKIVLTGILSLPVSSKGAERNFSALKHVKDYLCSTTAKEHSTGLRLMNNEKDVFFVYG